MTTGSDECQYSNITRVTGASENVAVDVEPNAGKNRLFAEIIERAGSLRNGAVSVGPSAVPLVAGSALPNRRGILVQNLGSVAIYLGASNVTTATGIQLSVKACLFLAVSETQDLYAISTLAAQDVRVMEVAS